MTDQNNLSLRGMRAAQQNNQRYSDTKHPWHIPYLKTCIIKDCREQPYYDGSIYYTCCVACLQQTQLGPFYKKNSKILPKVPKPPTQLIVTASNTPSEIDSKDLF